MCICEGGREREREREGERERLNEWSDAVLKENENKTLLKLFKLVTYLKVGRVFLMKMNSPGLKKVNGLETRAGLRQTHIHTCSGSVVGI